MKRHVLYYYAFVRFVNPLCGVALFLYIAHVYTYLGALHARSTRANEGLVMVVTCEQSQLHTNLDHQAAKLKQTLPPIPKSFSSLRQYYKVSFLISFCPLNAVASLCKFPVIHLNVLLNEPEIRLLLIWFLKILYLLGILVNFAL